MMVVLTTWTERCLAFLGRSKFNTVRTSPGVLGAASR